ncbi:hypothetical protein F4680DRAFT_227402 [Xylaria scruposa]|nr:hypothetical protein F4680DRAFT_227402 [Xylaria scruposa]
MPRGEYGSYHRRDHGCSGHDSHSHTSSSRSGTRGRPAQADSAKWRWNCCNCDLQNLSFTYDTSCPGCAHRRDTYCRIWAVE